MGKLEGKTALVTGGSQGIGLAVARELAEDGARVVIMGRRADSLKSARERLQLEVSGAHFETYAGSAADEADFKAALAKAYGLAGHLDIVVSVVGEPQFKPLLMRELNDVKAEFAVNFDTAFLAVRHGVPLMERGGAIVCVSSVAATQAGWGLSIYGSAKAAVERFVRAAAYELGGAGIRVNAVRPGATLPPERAADPALAEMISAYTSETPMGRLGEPEEIARVVRFLAGPDSGWVTGQTFSVDGGLDQGRGADTMDAVFGADVMAAIRVGKPA